MISAYDIVYSPNEEVYHVIDCYDGVILISFYTETDAMDYVYSIKDNV